MTLYTKRVAFCGADVLIACDGKCSHAWGPRRPKQQLSPDPEGVTVWAPDVVWASDDEAGPCPLQGMDLDSEGGDLKPDSPALMNKWCARACERKTLCDLPPQGGQMVVSVPDWSRPRFNVRREYK